MQKKMDFIFKKRAAKIAANILCCTALAFSSILCMGNWWEPKMPPELEK